MGLIHCSEMIEGENTTLVALFKLKVKTLKFHRRNYCKSSQNYFVEITRN